MGGGSYVDDRSRAYLDSRLYRLYNTNDIVRNVSSVPGTFVHFGRETSIGS